MDFGNEVQGEWHLWIYCAAWRIDSAHDVLAGSEDSRETIELVLETVEQKELQSVAVTTPSLGIDLDFGDLVFRVFPVHAAENEHWMLYTPSGAVLVAGPGASWKCDE